MQQTICKKQKGERKICKTRAYNGKKKKLLEKILKNRKGTENSSILSGIHYQDSGGMLWINPSDAFSVLLTFSLSPKRHVVCQRAFIKLDQKENNVKTLPRDVPTGYHREGVSCSPALGQQHTAASLKSSPPLHPSHPLFLSTQAGIKREKTGIQFRCVQMKGNLLHIVVFRDWDYTP